MKIHYHSDHLGSASFVTDRGGYVVQHLQYLPYGELFVSQRNSDEFDSRYKFTAKELDNETSYTYFGARYYDSELSGWLSVDPMSDKYPSLSPYCYTANNPVVLVDPNGMWIDDYYIHANGSIEVKKTNDNFDRFYLISGGFNNKQTNIAFIGQFNKNEYGLIKLPASFSFTNLDFGVSFSFNVKKGNENECYISGLAFAALIGALSTVNFHDVTITRVSNYDGSSPGSSKSHFNGNNLDLRYLSIDKSGNAITLNNLNFDISRQNELNEALYKFGWKDLISDKFVPHGENSPQLLNHARPLPFHIDHEHLQGFHPNYNEM